MFEKVINKKTKSIMELLKKNRILDGFYLAGGTGLALLIGHRKSKDLDFFTKNRINFEKLFDEIKRNFNIEVDIFRENTLSGWINEIKVSFFEYHYDNLFPYEDYMGIDIASIADIGCMKMVAVVNRGTKRDFIDLYFICRYYFSIEKMFEFYKKKYGEHAMNEINIRKALVYFEDADKEVMPLMMRNVKWRDVKKFFEKEVMKG